MGVYLTGRAPLHRSLVVISGVLFIAIGAVAYITGLNIVGAVVLVFMGIIGIVAGVRGYWERRDEY
jgi:hypothetical protein